MVPFSLRLLRADFPRHLNKPNEALSRLYAMRSTCDKVIETAYVLICCQMDMPLALLRILSIKPIYAPIERRCLSC